MGIEANQYEVHILKNQKRAPHLAGYIHIHLSAESFGAFNKIGPRHKKTFTEQTAVIWLLYLWIFFRDKIWVQIDLFISYYSNHVHFCFHAYKKKQ